MPEHKEKPAHKEKPQDKPEHAEQPSHKPEAAHEAKAHKQEPVAGMSPEELKKLERRNRWYQSKSAWRRIWYFIWYDDSLASWLVNVVLAFIIIKFIVYPVLGWALGTGYPIVAVVSSSMEHPGTFNDWWYSQCNFTNGVASQEMLYAHFGIDKVQFGSFKFTNGFDRGDLMVLSGAQNANVGDILVYNAPGFSDPIIHRIVARRTGTDNKIILETKGDHNCGQGPYEQSITQDRVLGKAVLRIPWLGWIKIGFVNLVMYVKCAFTPQAADCALWRGIH
jgi:signal peptidase I